MQNYLEEQPAKLFPKSDVDNKVDGGIDSDEEIANIDELIINQTVESLQDIIDQCQNVAEEKDHDDTQQHRSQSDFLPLQSSQSRPLLIC